MLDPVTVLFGCAALLLAYTALAARRHQRQVDGLRGDIDDLEAQNRRLQDERRALGEELARARVALDGLRQQVAALETEKAEVERQRRILEETADRLEKARVELEASLTALQGRHAALESRVIEFQGEWHHQMTTLEEEIATLGRQLGEFRKGTRLPIPAERPT